MKHYLRFLITMLLLVLFGGGSFGQGQETVVKTLSFPPDNEEESKVNDYISTKTYTIGSDSWSVTGFNNANWSLTENGHKIIRCGRKNNTSVASIATSKAYGEPITKVVVTLEVYGEDCLNYAVLTVSSDNKFSSDIQTVRLTPSKLKKGDVAFEIPNPTKDSFYKLTFDCKSCKKNGQAAYVSKVQYFAVETKTATNVTFGEKVDGESFNVTEGEESTFSGKIATEKDGVAGTIKYSSNNKDVVSVDETTGVVKFGKTFGTATITALFTPTDAAKYKESSASYTINYNKKQRIATTLTFKETSGSVNIGETFTLPEPTLKAGDEVLTGRTFKYSSSATDVASIDEKTGTVTIHSAGNTVLTAKFEDPEDKYESSTAEFTLKVIDPNAIVFSAANGSFEKVGGYSDKAKDVVFVSASGENYTFNLTECMKASKPKYGWLQMKNGLGVVKSPLFDAFPNGYKVTVYYAVGVDSKDLVITSKELPNASSTTTVTGEEYVTTISLPLSTAKFIMTANNGVKYVSKIELTPLAAPAIVTLDETSDNISTVISDNAGRTVNVTLKRSISKDYLNTVCLPFDLSAEKIAEVFGEGSVVSDYTSVTGTVMNFTPVTEMVANHPYIVNATETFDTKNIAGVTLKTIAGNENKIEFENTEKTFLADFVGSPLIHEFTYTDGSELFLGKDGKLYRPNAKGDKMKGMRAYFEVVDYTGTEAKVNIGGALSSIDKLMNGEAMTGKVYNLNGQYVGNTLDGLAKGLYIMNGKKYVVK
ncbi:Ig-like domain-containing protein [uncultured Prevotella sp.]|uniref:Ig-like domain-containing protein n=1 Tax=uncultured Prevotella sp. TaxID=159272 RepID=UPI00261E92A2|nr:Ig-like domain-containing protein [uncultured Prevotella sp.]